MPGNSINILDIALDYINQGIVIYDMELTVIGFNRRTLELLEMPIDQFSIGDPFSKWVQYNAERGTYGDQGTVEEQAEKRMAIAQTFEPYQMNCLISNNKTIEAIGKFIPDTGYITTYSDVTERINVEKLARESEERFRDFTVLGSDWFWEMGPDLRFTYH